MINLINLILDLFKIDWLGKILKILFEDLVSSISFEDKRIKRKQYKYGC